MKDIVVIEDIVKEYGGVNNKFRALDGISITISEGEFIGIMGPSGSGKSTLLNIIATIDRATTGHVLVNGEKVFAMQDVDLCRYRRENLGFIFQDCNLLENITVRDNILAPLTLAGIKDYECNKRLKNVSERLGITEILDKYPKKCSGGQRQRAAVARALITNPRMIVADEPTGALDTKNSIELLNILKDLNEKDGIAIVVVTHDALIASYSKRLLLIRDGKIDRIMERGKTKQLNFYNSIVEETSKESGSLFKEVN